MSGDAPPKDKSDSKEETSMVVVMDPSEVMDIIEVDAETERKIDIAVKQIIAMDNRISGEPETMLAIRDYVRTEVVCQIVFKRIVKGNSDSTGDERLFRAVLNAKNMLRDEIWGKVKGRKKKENEVDKVTSILIDQKIIEAKKETDVIGGEQPGDH